MYDWPQFAQHTRSLEAAIAESVFTELGLVDGTYEDATDHTDLTDLWMSPDLLVAQTCGYPLVTQLVDQVVPLGIPHYDAPGCEAERYVSHIIVRCDDELVGLQDLCGKVAVVNGPDSQSGYNAFRHAIAPLAGGQPYFAGVLQSGSHLKSLKAVAASRADVCCVDAICWEYTMRTLPELAQQLRPIARTQSVPGLPLVTSKHRSEKEISALGAVLAEVFSCSKTEESRRNLGICGFTHCSFTDYAPILQMKHEAEMLGYPAVN
ncbi:hypothetical protein E1178_14950 [Roseibium hamelinense]|nr:hypothetical protein [Roseibium hamelinense]